MLALCGLSAISIGACGDDDPPDESSHAGHSGAGKGGGGSGGAHAGSGGAHAGNSTGGQTPVAGAGGALGGNENGGAGGEYRSVDTCGPYPLSSYCVDAPVTCARSPEDIGRTSDACPFGGVQQFASDCGGTVVRESFGYVSDTWTFDADGQLIGHSFRTDAEDRCQEGGYSFQWTYGETCRPVGEAEELCDAVGGAGGAGGAAGAGGSSP